MKDSKGFLAVSGLIIALLVILYALSNHEKIQSVTLPGGSGVKFETGSPDPNPHNGPLPASGATQDPPITGAKVPNVIGLNNVDASRKLWDAGYQLVEQYEASSADNFGK